MVSSRWIRIAGFAVAAVAISACSGIKEDLGLAKRAPDEFTVVKRPPLSMPPDFALRPPRPGERGPEAAEMRQQARESLIGSTSGGMTPGGMTSGGMTSVATAPSAGAAPSASGPGGFGASDPLAGTGFAIARDDAPMGAPAAPAQPSRTGARASYGEMALLDRAGVDESNPQIRQLVDQESAQIAADEDTLVDRLMFWRDRPPAGEVVDAPAETRRLRENAALGRAPTEGTTPTIERKAEGRGISLF